MHPRLSQQFTAAAGKVLSAVETDPRASHQHEFNGVALLQQVLGEPNARERLPTRFIRIDDDLLTETWDGEVTWYDARQRARAERGVNRFEYRLYYPSNPVMAAAAAGDTFILARRTDGGLMAVIAPGGSSVEAQLRSLFGVEHQGELFSLGSAPDESALDLSDTDLLEALGIEVDWTDESALEGLVDAFGREFPTTVVFSAYARAHGADVDPLTDPDSALMEWMGTEEALFRTFERHLLQEPLDSARGDVDVVVGVVLRALQRRRARAGQALENHVEELLDRHGIVHTRGGITEGRKRPDFLFPGVDYYRDPSWPADRLLMLGAKTTCRDRWRQVLTEADRIPDKHLITLEAPISRSQVEEMRTHRLHLVIPVPLQVKFDPDDRTHLLSVQEALVLTRRAARI